MRIAYVTQNINRGDGQGRVCFELAKHALVKGHQVSLFTNFAEPELIASGAQWIPLHPRKWSAGLMTVREFTYLADRALHQLVGEIEIVHGFGYSLSVPHQINSVQFVHRTWGRSPAHPIRVSKMPYALYHWLYTLLNTFWEGVAFRQARRVVACSPMVRKQLIDAGVPAKKLRVQCNGVDLSEFGERTKGRKDFALPYNVPLLLFAGDIRTPRKNLGTVLRALREIPGVHLAVVGALPRSPYPAMAVRLGIESRVHFLGFRNDLPAIMAVADAFVFPAQYEPFGMVVLEAMASRMPVISASTVGAADLVSAAAGIVLSDPADVISLVAAIRHLLSHPEIRKTMGNAGCKIAQKHSWEHMGAAYLEIYSEILGLPKHVDE